MNHRQMALKLELGSEQISQSLSFREMAHALKGFTNVVLSGHKWPTLYFLSAAHRLY